jgi:hypothetical protein
MAIKTAVKKSVKKTVKKASRKIAPKFIGMTAEEFTAILAKNDAIRAEGEAKATAIRAAADAELKAADAELKAADARLKVAQEEMALAIKNLTANIDRISARYDDLSDNVGGVNRRLGQIIELIIVPYLRLDLNAKGGHNFEDMRGNRKVNVVAGDKKNTVAEMDIFLYGPAETMAVEIKTHMKRSDVVKQLERLKTLRTYETEAEIKGKKLFGGMIGVSVDADARKFAKKNGLYVIGIHEKEDKLLIDAPEQRGEW